MIEHELFPAENWRAVNAGVTHLINSTLQSFAARIDVAISRIDAGKPEEARRILAGLKAVLPEPTEGNRRGAEYAARI